MRAKSDELAVRGRPPGGRPPFGYSAGYKLNPTEAEAVRLMARRVLEGASLLQVARELDAAGVSTREGRGWHHSSVRAALLNPAIAGLRIHRREVAGPGDWEPVLERSEWEEVRAVLADPARKRKRAARRYLLAGMVTNTNGDPMTGRPDRGAGGTKDRRCYATRTPAKPASSVGADDLESLVVEAVLAAFDDAEFEFIEPMDAGGAELQELERELAELAALRGAGTITLSEWLAAREPLTARLEEARSASSARARPSSAVRLLGQRGALRRAWPKLDFNARREVLATVVDKVVVGPANRGRWTSVADRLMPQHGGGIQWRA